MSGISKFSTAVRGQRVSQSREKMWAANPAGQAVPAEDGSPAPGRWRRRVRPCQRPGPAGISQTRTCPRQKRSQGDSGATKTLVGGAKVADSCPQKGGLEGARVSMSAERNPACQRIDDAGRTPGGSILGRHRRRPGRRHCREAEAERLESGAMPLTVLDPERTFAPASFANSAGRRSPRLEAVDIFGNRSETN